MDILQATLAAGIKVQKYVPSYGDQANDVSRVVKCELPSIFCNRYHMLTGLFSVDFYEKFRGYHVSATSMLRSRGLLLNSPPVEKAISEASSVLLSRNLGGRAYIDALPVISDDESLLPGHPRYGCHSRRR